MTTLNYLKDLTAPQTRDLSDSQMSSLEAKLVKALTGPGPAGLGLQVVVGAWSGQSAPIAEARKIHAERQGKKIFPLVVALEDARGNVWLMGPSGDTSPVGPVPGSQAVRILQAGLDEPSGLRGRQRISHLLKGFTTTEVAGMNNSGLFATHYLVDGARQTPQWAAAAAEAAPWLGLRGEKLISAMGFTARRAANAAHILTTKESNEPRAAAVLLSEEESFDSASPRFAVSPVSFGLNLAKREGADWLMVLRGSQIRLYPAKPGVGVGSRGLAETYFELDLALLSEDEAGFLGMVFSATALTPGGTIELLLEGSDRYATGLGERLRQRVYDEVVPKLSVAVADRLAEMDSESSLDLAYRITLRILFRLLFQAYAEDQGLLPYERNDRYTRNSLKRWARDFVEQPELVNQLDPGSHAIWDDLRQVWGVIDTGNRTWDVPAYNGGLFGSDPELHPEGALIDTISLDDSVIGYALRHLLVDQTPDGTLGPVDFRSLSVREFGTIYEGLLESSLSRADVDLTLDKRRAYVPAKKKDEVLVEAGEVYFHNASGERKATGSYFTPSFAVAHLLERALEPSIDDHLDRIRALIDKGSTSEAELAFFDFRVADLAMGSGHFLVAAIDTIEAAMSAFLAEHPLPGITDELRRLEQAAREALGDDEADYEIEPSALLRRQIARRCIYGLDINEIAVELARVAVWIHTFVPGLPMSSLDHSLVCANSLTGIGTIDEAIEALEPDRKPGQPSLITVEIERELEAVLKQLQAVANTAEATKAEVKAAAEAYRQAQTEAEGVRQLFDAAVAARTGLLGDLKRVELEDVRRLASRPEIRQRIRELNPGHMPFLFPEVFLRDRPGFDCLIGNPPWEELMADRLGFWTLRFPGLKGMKAADREQEIQRLEEQRPDLLAEFEDLQAQAEAMRRVILNGPYPGIGTGDIDLYKAFAWRFLHLSREGGRVGVVLPRSAVAAAGTAAWREAVLDQGTFEDVCLLTNGAGWVFPEVDVRYTVALTTFAKGFDSPVAFCGPFHSLDEYLAGRDQRGQAPRQEFAEWSDSLSFPRVPDAKAGAILRAMKRHPRFDSTEGFEFRPVAELHATNDRKLFDTDLTNEKLTMPVLTGASFEIWNPDFGEPYGLADPEEMTAHLLNKARRGTTHGSSAFKGLIIEGPHDHPSSQARIAFRDVTNPTNQRTTIACLLPPGVALVNKAPYLLRRSGNEEDEAYLLGVMCSIPFDWYSRRWVELNLNFFILNPMPVPRPDREHPLRVRATEVAGRLAAVDDRFADWAEAVGVPVGSLSTEPERSEAIAELDAVVSLLYELSWDEVEHIFATFHRGWDYGARLARVKVHYDRWVAEVGQ